MTTDQDAARASMERLLRFDSDGTHHDLYHDDAILEFPQSGERFEGLANFREWRDQYPAEVTARLSDASPAPATSGSPNSLQATTPAPRCSASASTSSAVTASFGTDLRH